MNSHSSAHQTTQPQLSFTADTLSKETLLQMQVDLISLEQGQALRTRTLAESLNLTFTSLGNLLAYPKPPVELLRITKDFAKACRQNPHSPMPKEIASVLYFASIAAALIRCGDRISDLTNETLAEGFRWTLALPWLDAQTRVLIEEGLQLVNIRIGESA